MSVLRGAGVEPPQEASDPSLRHARRTHRRLHRLRRLRRDEVPGARSPRQPDRQLLLPRPWIGPVQAGLLDRGVRAGARHDRRPDAGGRPLRRAALRGRCACHARLPLERHGGHGRDRRLVAMPSPRGRLRGGPAPALRRGERRHRRGDRRGCHRGPRERLARRHGEPATRRAARRGPLSLRATQAALHDGRPRRLLRGRLLRLLSRFDGLERRALSHLQPASGRRGSPERRSRRRGRHQRPRRPRPLGAGGARDGRPGHDRRNGGRAAGRRRGRREGGDHAFLRLQLASGGRLWRHPSRRQGRPRTHEPGRGASPDPSTFPLASRSTG